MLRLAYVNFHGTFRVTNYILQVAQFSL